MTNTSRSTALGQLGIRSWELSDGNVDEAVSQAVEIERLGYGSIWLRASGFFARARHILEATDDVVVASSVFNIWANPAAELAESCAALQADFAGRILIGLGVSHAPYVESPHVRYERPLAQMEAYLDEFDAVDPGSGAYRVLAALGPGMLGLARDRSVGAHPYLVPVEHTRFARDILGPAALLAPGLVVIAETEPLVARRRGRQHLGSPYLGLPNYRRNLLRSGFVADDLDEGGSDELVDGVVAWGGVGPIAEQVRAHRRAGADHVALHVVPRETEAFPSATWRDLATALT